MEQTILYYVNALRNTQFSHRVTYTVCCVEIYAKCCKPVRTFIKVNITVNVCKPYVFDQHNNKRKLPDPTEMLFCITSIVLNSSNDQRLEHMVYCVDLISELVSGEHACPKINIAVSLFPSLPPLPFLHVIVGPSTISSRILPFPSPLHHYHTNI